MQKTKKASIIFELIRKLDKDERRAFKLFATTYEKKSNVAATLFDIIYDYTHALPEGAEPDEVDISAQLKKEKITSQYANVKSRLKSLLMDFMYEQGMADSEIEKIHRKICLSVILVQKGQKDLALSILREAKKEATDCEDFVALLDCLDNEFFHLSSGPSPSDEEQRGIVESIKDTQAAIADLWEARYGMELARKYYVRKEKMPAHIADMDSVKRKIASALSVKAKHYLYYHLGILSMMQDPASVTAGYQAAHINMLEQNLIPMRSFLAIYFVSFGPYMITLARMGDYAQYKEQIQRIEAKSKLYSRVYALHANGYILMSIWRYKLNYNHMVADKAAMKRDLGEMEHTFESYRKHMVAQNIAIYTVDMMRYYFYCADYAKAYEWATLRSENIIMSVYNTIAGHVIALLSAYELRCDAGTLRALLKKAKYYLHTQDVPPALGEWAAAFIACAEALHSARGPGEKKREIAAILSLHNSALRNDHAPLKDMLEGSHLASWLEAQTDHIPIS